jgi:hypothetical protein
VRSKVSICQELATVVVASTSTKNGWFPFPSSVMLTPVLNNIFAPTLGDQTFTFYFCSFRKSTLNLIQTCSRINLCSDGFSILTTLLERLFPVLSGFTTTETGFPK